MDTPAATDGTVAVHRPERTFPVLPDRVTLALAAPPEPAEAEAASIWSTLLPVVGSMSAVAFALMSRNPLYLAVAGLVVVASIGSTFGVRRADKRRDQRRRDRQQGAYRRHVEDLVARSRDAGTVQRAALEQLYPPLPRLLEVARDRGALWERRPEHADFGAVRLGLGGVPARVGIEPAAGSGPVSERDEALVELAAAAVRTGSTLDAAPLTLDLTSLSSVAVVAPPAPARGMVVSWLGQLATFHAPGELRFLGWVDAASAAGWDWTKWLPHTVDPLSRSGRSITVDLGAFGAALGELVASRDRMLVRAGAHGQRPQHGSFQVAPGQPWVIVLVDGYAPDADVARLPALDEALRRGIALGITVVALCPDRGCVPVACSARVDREADGTWSHRLSGVEPSPVSGIVADQVDVADAEALARWLAPRRVARGESGALDGGPVRLLALLDESPTTGSNLSDLRGVPIGRTDDAEPLVLDINEAAGGGHGPHGILVGATGSGKSELLRSFVAGLAARHPPTVLNALLVDFKGGAAFAELAALPHTVGLVTNLVDDLSLIDRVQASLAGELERRQQLLGSTGHASIHAYRRAAPGSMPEPLPYLVVVVDEFGELLTARPELLDTFVQIGRLGRSLGIHLLLASQRLEEGRLRGLESHLRYRLAMQTFTAGESIAVLGSAAAYELPARPGVGYLKVDSSLTRFQAALATLPAGRSAAPDGPSELQTLVADLCSRGDARGRAVWTPPLPGSLALGPWTAEFADADSPGLRATIGLVDEPHRQRQTPLVVDLRATGHVGIVGGTRSGRTTSLVTLVRALAADHDPSALQVYAVAHGGDGLAPLANLPHTGAIVGRGQPDLLLRLVSELEAVVDERLQATRRSGAESFDDLSTSGDADTVLPHPFRAHVLLLVDGMGQLRSEQPDVDTRLVELAASGAHLGIHLVVTASRWYELRPALLDSLGLRLELRLGDPADSDVSRTLAAAVPRRPGRGLTRDGRHLQLAVAPDDHPVAHSPQGHRAPRVVQLPLRVHPPAEPSDAFALGLAEHRLAPVDHDLLAPGGHLLVYGDSGSGRTTLLRRLVTWLATRTPGTVEVHVVDPGRGLAGLAGEPPVVDYAYEATGVRVLVERLAAELATRRPPPQLPLDQLVERSWWRGPEHVLVVDDYDRLIRPDGSLLSPLVDLLAVAVDLGWHVVLARRAAGAARTAFDPFGQRLRELTPATLVLSGERGEGPLVSDVVAGPMPPGRGRLVRPGRGAVVLQTYLPDRESR